MTSSKAFQLAGTYASRRGVPSDQLEQFLHPDPEPVNFIGDLPQTAKAIWRVTQAVAKSERIALFGDYDADGVTSTTILTRFLQQTTTKTPVWHVPNRQTDLYGLSYETARHLDADLLIALDCGTHSKEAVAKLQENGTDVIIVDHHPAQPQDAANAHAILNPNLGTPHPELSPLCTAGLAFFLCQSLAAVWGVQRHWDTNTAIILSAIGTLGDACFLNSVNRALVKRGLARINRHSPLTSMPGLASMLASKSEPITRRRILYEIVPKINALGRLEDARLAVELLMERDPAKAQTMALHCDEANTRRQQLQQKTLEEALPIAEAILKENPDQKLLVLADSRWHHGIVGITASQIREKTNRTTILLAPYENTRWKGSGRAMPSEDIGQLADVLRSEGRVINAGGHAGAIGLLVDGPQLQPLQNWAKTAIVPLGSNNEPLYEILGDPNAISPQDWRELLTALEPFGRGNPMVAIAAPGWQLVRNPEPLRNGEGSIWALKGTFQDTHGHSINVTWKDIISAQRIWEKGNRYNIDLELSWKPYRGQTYYNWACLTCTPTQ